MRRVLIKPPHKFFDLSTFDRKYQHCWFNTVQYEEFYSKPPKTNVRWGGEPVQPDRSCIIWPIGRDYVRLNLFSRFQSLQCAQTKASRLQIGRFTRYKRVANKSSDTQSIFRISKSFAWAQESRRAHLGALGCFLETLKSFEKPSQKVRLKF